MLGSFAKKIFGSSNDRRLKGYRPKVAAINALEPEVQKLTDAELAGQTAAFREAFRRRQDARGFCSCRLSPRCGRRRAASLGNGTSMSS